MLKKLICLLTIMLALPALATSRGEKTVGLRAGYNTNNESPLAGVFFQYSFSRHFRLAPNVDYIFRNRGEDGIHANLNAHFPIGIGSGRFDIYPLAGIAFTTMYDHNEAGDDGDVSTRITRMGLNAGAGLEYYVSPSLKLHVEGKFSWVNDFNSGVFCVGIGYVF